MASQYFAILTDYGKQAFAKALSSKQPMQLTTFAVGDGNGQNVTPTANRTALAREKHRAAVSAVSLDPRNNKQVIVELTMPENVGGFYIREMGVFDNQNKLVAYANCPESFKPTLESGSGKVQVLRMILQVASSAAVTLSVDHSVIFVTRQQHTPKTITATSANSVDETGHNHAIDKASLTQQGIVQLTNDLNSDAENLALTAKAGKALAQQTAQVKQDVVRDYIPNTKKSAALNSTSNDMVATSSAVKTAYDKGVEAKNAADAAQRTANDGVAKAKTAQAAAEAAQRTANDGVAKAKAAQTTADNGVSKATTAQNTANSAVTKADNAQRAADNANNNANNRVPKTGDTTIVGALRAQHPQLNTGRWSEFQLAAKQGYWRLEVNPESHNANDRRFNMVYANGNAQHYLWFPTIGDSGQTVAYQSWVNNLLNNFINGSSYARSISPNKIQFRWSSNGNLELKIDNTELGYLHNSHKAYVETNVANGGYGGLNVVRKGTSGNFWARFEALPDRRWKFATENGSTIHLKNQSGNILLDSDISNATNGNNKAKVASEFALGELNKTKANLADFSYQKIGNFEIRRYPDGTMIQTYLIEQHDLKEWQEKYFTWAVAFAHTPMIFTKITTSVSGTHDCDVNILTKSNNRACYYHEYEHGNITQGNVRIQFYAIGRWK